MANPIQNNQVADKDVFKNLTEGSKELLKLIDQLTQSTKEFGQSAQKISKDLDFSKSADIAKVNGLLEELTKNTQNLTAAQKQRKSLQSDLAKTEKDRIKSIQKAQNIAEKRLKEIEKDKEKRGLQAIKDLEKRATAEKRAAAAAVRASERDLKATERTTKQKEISARRAEKQAAREKELNRAYNVQSRTLNNLRKRYKDLAVQNKENTKEGRKLLRSITVLDAKLKSVDKTVGQSQRNVGNYSSAFKGLGSNLGGFIGIAGGVAGAIAAIAAGIKAAVSLFTDFGLATAKVQAISGATGKEFEGLKNQAKALGESTAFTATQVANLQLELSKLGFDPTQINKSTEAILNFAVATDSDLARAGEVVASTLNAFQLEASEAGRVADVAALAFSSSALDIEKFATAIGSVGPAANAVDVSLERATAILGKIVDSGIDASTAGTQLRNVFIELEDRGLTWSEAIEQIKGSQNRLSTANELFGKRGAVVATVIANNSNEIDSFDESLQNAAGSAQKAADIIGDTLDGDIKRLQSAIQGATLGNEEFEGTFRKVVQFLTRALPTVIDFLGKTFNVVIDAVRPLANAVTDIVSVFRNIFIELGLVSGEFNLFVELINLVFLPLKLLGQAVQIVADGFKSLTSEVKKLINVDIKTWLNFVLPGFAKVEKESKKASDGIKNVAKSVGQLVESKKVLDAFKTAAVSAFNDSTKAIGDFIDKFKEAAQQVPFIKGIADAVRAVNRELIKRNATQALADQSATVQELNDAIKVQNDLIKDQNEREEIRAIQSVVKQLEAKRDALLGVVNAGKEENKTAKELAQKNLEIEKQLREDIEKVLNDEFQSELGRQAAIEALRDQARKDRREAELIAVQTELEEKRKVLDSDNKEIVDLEQKQEELLTEIALEGLDERAQDQADADEKSAEDKKIADDKRIAAEKAFYNETLELAKKGLNDLESFTQKVSQNNIDAIDREVAAIDRREDALRQAIANGSELASDSLTKLDEERAAKEQERQQEKKKQAGIELFIAGAKLITETGSLAGAAKDITGLKVIIDNLLNGFHDGGYTGDGGEWSTAGVVHKGEFVNTAKQVDNYGMKGWTASDFDKAVESGHFNQFNSDLTSDYLKYDTMKPVVNTTLDTSKIVNRLERVEDAVLKTIESNPKHSKEWDEERKEMLYILETKNRIEKERRKSFKY